MAEHSPSGPNEVGAEMDYPEHQRTYGRFLALTKYGTIVVISLLIAMAFYFLGGGGVISAPILFILLIVVGTFALR